nr:hypothetical protein [Escherichia coli]
MESLSEEPATGYQQIHDGIIQTRSIAPGRKRDAGQPPALGR